VKRISPSKAAALFAILSLLFASACRKHHKRIAQVPSAPQPSSRRPQPAPLAVPLGYSEEGLASWYGIPYHGRHAADGEIYDMETLVAAHRVLPFNTWLVVTNLSNNKAVKVRVIDRGPFVSGRIIDLSKAAAREIGLLGPGVGRVRLEVVAAPANIPSDDFYGVQVGAFSVRENAEHARLLYAQRYVDTQLAVKQGSIDMWRVIVGRETSVDAAQRLAQVLSVENKTVFVVRLDETVPAPAVSEPRP
jgi:rare lipoprotein A